MHGLMLAAVSVICLICALMSERRDTASRPSVEASKVSRIAALIAVRAPAA